MKQYVKLALCVLLSVCNVWVIRCNISEEAAIIAYGTIIGEI